MVKANEKKLLVVAALLILINLGGCTQNQSRTLDHMSSITTKDYVAISWQGRTYVPFCVIDKSYRGEQIGVVDNDDDDQIYKYKGYSENEWLISFYHSGLMDNSMLLREMSVTNIPDNLDSEYEWNQ